jgi:hypothetical protein
MQAHGEQLDEIEPAGIHSPLREASVPHDAAVPETRGIPAPGEESLSEAPHATRETSYTAVIEALVITALHVLEAHVWDVKKRVAVIQKKVAEVAEGPARTAGYRGTPQETPQPLCAAPQSVSHAPRRAEHPRD